MFIKQRGYCKGAFQEEEEEEVRKCETIREKPVPAKPTKETITIITDDIINVYLLTKTLKSYQILYEMKEL